jgi:uncharacterized metal-binding protein YceD (DUF177 family)
MTQDSVSAPTPPFSHPLKVAGVSAKASVLKLNANADELAGLARLWDVVSLGALTAELQVVRWKKDGVRLTGEVKADVVQACVVTLEPVTSKISETIDQTFVPEGSKLAKIVAQDAADATIDPDGPDLPELFAGETIDIGAIVAEFAALALDPYPRKPGVDFTPHLEDADTNDRPPSPFAALKDWKKD